MYVYTHHPCISIYRYELCGKERARIRIRYCLVNVFRMNMDTGEELLHSAVLVFLAFLWFYTNSIVFAPLRYYLYLCSFHFSWLHILLISTHRVLYILACACVLHPNILVYRIILMNHMNEKKTKCFFCWNYLKINQSYTYTVFVLM